MPIEFKRYFWDTEFEKLDIKKNMKYIITRLLTEGNLDAFRWVRENYTEEEIKNVARTSRKFNPLTANFLKHFYNLDEDEMMYYNNIKNSNYVYRG